MSRILKCLSIERVCHFINFYKTLASCLQRINQVAPSCIRRTVTCDNCLAAVRFVPRIGVSQFSALRSGSWYSFIPMDIFTICLNILNKAKWINKRLISSSQCSQALTVNLESLADPVISPKSKVLLLHLHLLPPHCCNTRVQSYLDKCEDQALNKASAIFFPSKYRDQNLWIIHSAKFPSLHKVVPNQK